MRLHDVLYLFMWLLPLVEARMPRLAKGKKMGKKGMIPEEAVVIASFSCGKCIEDMGKGQPVKLNDCDSYTLKQGWRYESYGGTSYQIINSQTNSCLAVSGCNDSKPVVAMDCLDKFGNAIVNTLWHKSGAELFSLGCFVAGASNPNFRKTLDANCDIGGVKLRDVAAGPNSDDPSGSVHQKYWMSWSPALLQGA